jgi:hypothetical protein
MSITTKIKSLHLLAVVFMLMSTTNLMAQLTGVKTIPGDYATVSAAVTALNTQGVGTGGVTFNVASGYTQSITAPIIITATGTAANPIVFQKSGTGLNPVITRTDVGSINTGALAGQGDAVVIIEGSDFITINGINVSATTVSSTTTGIEYGYYLRKGSATNGCKNVTITNCTITMNRGTSGYVMGIMSSNNDALSSATLSTGLTLTSVAGRNENLSFTNNNISNVQSGIFVRGFAQSSAPFDFYDNNIVVTGNTIQNYGGGSTSVVSYGIYAFNYTDFAANNNVINNTAGGGTGFTGTAYGIFLSLSSNQGVCTANGNTITLAHAAVTTNSQLQAIRSDGSSIAGSTTGSMSMNNNTISFGQTGGGAVTGLYLGGNNPSNTINNNTQAFTVNKVSGSYTGVYLYYSGTISNNTIGNITYTTGGASTGGTLYGIQTIGAFSNSYNYQIFNNTISNITNISTSAVTYGIYAYYGGANSNVYNNAISNITAAGSGALYGIFSNFSNGKVYSNNISGLTGSGTGNVSGLAISGSTDPEFYRNKITNIQNTNAGGTAFGISNISNNGTCLIYNNVIGNINAPAATNATTPIAADAVRGISITNTNASSSIIVDYNTIYLSATSTGTNFSSSGIFHTSSATATTANLVLRNNIIINLSGTTGTGVASVIRRSTATQLNNFNAASNNNMLFAGTPSASRVIYMEAATTQPALSGYQTLVAPRDNYAMTGETFTYSTAGNFFISLTPSSADYLKPVAGITTQVEGGAIQITGITNDYANVVRAGNAGYTGTGVAPDRGAFEFNGITTAPQISIASASPSFASTSCTAVAHTINLNIASTGGTISSAVLTYAFNGGTPVNVTLVNTSGTTWTGTIPAATPANATVTWFAIATNPAGSTIFNGTSYIDAPLTGATVTAAANPSTICSGQATSLVASLITPLPTYDSPTISIPTFDEDIANVTVSLGTQVLLNNTTPINSLSGTIGTAIGTAGGFADFSALATVNMMAGQTYNFSISSQTTGTSFSNSLAIFIDWNKNGLFTDAGEMVYTPPTTISGPHTRTGTFTVPSWAFGSMRMRVVCLETLISSYATTSSWGEREDYMLNVTGTTSWTQGSTVVGTTNPLGLTLNSTSTYVASVGTQGCTITSSPVTVTVLALPAAPVVTNSTHCGFQIPTASVASVTNGGGTGAFNWYTDAAGTASAQGQNFGPLATYWTNNFATSALSNATISGNAAISGGALVLHPNVLSQSGGLFVNAAGTNTDKHEISFKYTSQGGGVTNTADGMAFSFGDDVNALAATPNAENGTGTKLKIAFDTYTNGANTQGIYLMYNCNVANQTPTTPGVLAYSAASAWVGATSDVVVSINNAGVLNMTLNGAPLFTNIQLPAAYLAANTANWAYVWRSRSGGIASGTIIDDVVIKRGSIAAGPTTVASVVSSTTTFYVNENGTNGCLSPLVPVVVTVTAPPAINIATSVTPTFCLGGNVTLTASSAASPAYAYTWSTASYPGSGMTAASAGATRPLTPTAAGTYVYTVTGVNANCNNQVTQTVVVNPNPTITQAQASPAPICSGSTLNLVAASVPSLPGTAAVGAGTLSNTTTSYPTPFGNFWWGAKQQFLFTAAELTAQGLLPGNLTSVAFDITTAITTPLTNYTISMKNTTVTQLTVAFETGMSTVYTVPVYTPGTGLGYANNAITFQTPFNWDGTSNIVVEICFNNTSYVSNAAARYTVAFTGAWHGFYQDAAGVCAQTTGGTVSADRTNMMFGGNIGTNLTSSLNWLWTSLGATTATTTTVLTNNTTAAITQPAYQVRATNPITGCFTNALTSTVVVNPLPVVNAGIDQLICSNNATMPATLTGSATFGTGLNYVWSGPVAGVTNATPFQIGATGTFVVTGTDVNGCVDTDDVIITYSAIPAANAGVDQAICLNQTATFNAAGLAPYTWTMTNYANSGISAPVAGSALVVTPTAAGTYTYQLNVQNAVGCTNNDQAVLTIYALPVVNAGIDQTVCNASPATLSGSGAITYAWVTTHPSLNVSNATPFFPSQTASYTVTGTNINGCQNQDVVVVNVLPQPFVNAGLDQTICAGTPVILNATTTLASPTAVVSPYTWTGGYANNSQFVPTTNQTLTVSVVGANGCTNQDQMLITVLALPTVNAGVDQTICSGTGATLNATGAATYVWNNNVTQGVPFFPTASQIYTVTGIGANGCTNVDQAQVNVATGPSVTVSAAQTVCANDAATFSAVPQNSLGGFWTTSGNGTISPSISSAAITYLPAANDPVVVTLTYVATNACGSTSSATNVNVLPIPTVNAGPDQTICDGSSVVLNATGNGNVTWLTPNVSNGLAFIPVSTTTYTATATGLNNCSNQDQVTVTVVALPDVDAGTDLTICSGEEVTLAATGATAYQWTGGIANGTAFAPGTTATYTVTGTTANGCAGTDQVTVYVNATPEAIASIVDDVTLTATPGVYNYQWINCATGTAVPNASFATFNALANGTYAVIVSTPQGCSDQSDCITIDAVSIDQITEIAMSVQPNPTSGELSISMPADLTAQAQVFDAQGKLVIDLTNVSNGSTLNLTNMTTGVYMIRITAADSVQTFRVVKQ